VPGKTYEYLGSGRPILAAVPDGDARDILSRVGHAHLCRPDDVDAMVGIIRDLARRRRERGREPDAASGVAERFDRRALTAQLAAVFGDVLGSEPTQRGTWLLRA
jgi:glycosyltransferase involved in cell wall biosynthesis